MSERPSGARRSSGGRSQRAGGTRRSSSGSRSSSGGRSRQRQSAQSGMPQWFLFLIIGLPIVGIVGMITWKVTRTEEVAEVVDPNVDINDLQNELPAVDEGVPGGCETSSIRRDRRVKHRR